MGQSLVIAENSTTTVLTAGATFTGTWFKATQFPCVVVAVLTDQTATLNVDFSPDGVNQDSTLSYSVAAAVNEVHRLTCTRAYFRVRLQNTGSSTQSYLRLQSILGEFPLLSSPLSGTVQQDADAIVVRSVDYEFDIASGRFQGVSIVNKFGTNSDIDTGSVPEDIWEGGGLYTGFPTGTAETLSVVSASANDTAAGSGARTIRIVGLDANFNVQSETVTLNGTTPVNTVNTFMRAHTATVLTSGSSNTAFNAGLITIKHTTTTANVFLTMLAGRNQTNCSAYTVPAGYTAYMRHFRVVVEGGASSTANGYFYVGAYGASPRYRRPFVTTSGSILDVNIFGGLIFDEKTDLVLRIAAVSANNSVVYGGYDLILVAN